MLSQRIAVLKQLAAAGADLDTSAICARAPVIDVPKRISEPMREAWRWKEDGMDKEAGGREAVGGQLHLVPATVSAAPAAVQARTAESWRARQHTAP